MMLRDTDSLERKLEKLTRMNAALIQRLEKIEERRGPAYAMSRATAVLEREVMARNLDLETALSELAAINAELSAAREVADQANRAKSRFLRAASHDLLQPLSAAKLFLSHLREVSTDTMQRDLVSYLTATIDSSEELIRALSNIAKLDSQSFRTNLAPIPMGRLFRRLVIDTQALASARKIDLRFVPTAATVLSDGIYLRQIVQNLITNAVKYTTGQKVLVGLRYDRHDPDETPGVWLEVLDQGPGIDPADQEKIFMEFERLAAKDQQGTGLGLSIVQRACDQLGHRLELRSLPGKGSRFRVRLPLVEPLPLHDPNPPRRPAAPRREEPVLAQKRILLVENDLAMQAALTSVLQRMGLVTRAASNLADARRIAINFLPELVVSDYRLDFGETGIDVLTALAEEFNGPLPAVIVSAEDPEEIWAAAGSMPISVLEKPVAEGDLRRALIRALAHRPRQD